MNLFITRREKLLLYASFIILLDQISKFLLLITLGPNRSINIIPNLINFTLVKNKGAAFGFFSNSTTLLTFISIFTSFILIIIILKSKPISYWNSIGLAYFLGGTLGNGIDRLFKGYVLDFIEILPIDFPIFNLADISINFAIICFIIDTIISKDKLNK